MRINVYETKIEMGLAAARQGAELLRSAIAERGSASLVLATGASQFEILDALLLEEGIEWQCVTGFHLDEYCGISPSHPASFRKYLWSRFVSRLPVPMRDFCWIRADADAGPECHRLGDEIAQHEIDVAFVGIGENGHLAFNDPPADFDANDAYLVVELDEACRRQQFHEGWFASLESVPRRAISMSIKQILRSRSIICTVPDDRKAIAVAATVDGPVDVYVPASALQLHGDTTMFLDRHAASHLKTHAMGPASMGNGASLRGR